MKKIKVEPSIINPKKKQQQQQQSIVKNENSNKTTVNNKKSQLTTSNKPTPITEEKPTKNLPIKDSNQTLSSNTNGSTEGTKTFFVSQ
jgi:hypothetical protein